MSCIFPTEATLQVYRQSIIISFAYDHMSTPFLVPQISIVTWVILQSICWLMEDDLFYPAISFPQMQPWKPFATLTLFSYDQMSPSSLVPQISIITWVILESFYWLMEDYIFYSAVSFPQIQRWKPFATPSLFILNMII